MKQQYSLTLPVSKTKKIAKITNPNHSIGGPAAQLLTFSTEYITRYILMEAEKEAMSEKARQITYQHIKRVITRTPGLAYLEDTVPEKLIVVQEQEPQEQDKQDGQQ